MDILSLWPTPSCWNGNMRLQIQVNQESVLSPLKYYSVNPPFLIVVFWAMVLFCLTASPWGGNWHIPPKKCWASIYLYIVINQNFTVTALRASDPTKICLRNTDLYLNVRKRIFFTQTVKHLTSAQELCNYFFGTLILNTICSSFLPSYTYNFLIRIMCPAKNLQWSFAKIYL